VRRYPLMKRTIPSLDLRGFGSCIHWMAFITPFLCLQPKRTRGDMLPTVAVPLSGGSTPHMDMQENEV
jgi:hypothetical protein